MQIDIGRIPESYSLHCQVYAANLQLAYKLLLLSCLSVTHHITLENSVSWFQMTTYVLGAYSTLGNENKLTILHCNI